MLVRIFELIAIGVVIGAVVALLARARKTLPGLRSGSTGVDGPARARLSSLAARDERLRETLDLDQKIATLGARPRGDLPAELLADVRSLVAAIADLCEVRAELQSHLSGFDEARLQRDAEVLGASRVEALRVRLAELRGRPAQLEVDIAEGVAELRTCYLELLEGLGGRHAPGGSTTTRVRARAESLRARASAEAELRAALSATSEA